MKKSVIIIDGLYMLMLAIVSLIVFGKETYISNRAAGRSVKLFAACGLILIIVTLMHTLSCCGNEYIADAKEAIVLAKVQMIVRLVQIPICGFVFLFCTAMTFSFVNINFGFALMLGKLINYIITGMASVGVYTMLYKSGLITKRQRTEYSIFSFFYMFDLFIALKCYREVKNRA
ncbi:MAG: hypothetical protein J5802_02410 [Butyrivibrio sp.]|nr:hypothetical protein [Butyrivibrio sp.]